MFPRFVRIRQIKPADRIENVANEVRNAVAGLQNAGKLDLSKLNGKSVGIAVGSRGIANLPVIVRTLVDIVKEADGRPTVFAAMNNS